MGRSHLVGVHGCQAVWQLKLFSMACKAAAVARVLTACTAALRPTVGHPPPFRHLACRMSAAKGQASCLALVPAVKALADLVVAAWPADSSSDSQVSILNGAIMVLSGLLFGAVMMVPDLADPATLAPLETLLPLLPQVLHAMLAALCMPNWCADVCAHRAWVGWHAAKSLQAHGRLPMSVPHISPKPALTACPRRAKHLTAR